MQPTTTETLNVLIVEDSPTQAMLLKQALEEHQHNVTVAQDGVEALDELAKALPHVVISDIAMPRMNGFDFCQKVRADAKYRDIPIILLTSLTDPMDVIKGIACGADSFLTKPCEINFLMSTMHDVAQNKQTQTQKVTGQPLAFFYNGKYHSLQIDQVQITNLLLSTYLNAIQKNNELELSYRQLTDVNTEMLKKNEELSRLNNQKNQFLGMAAHDLRNPLGVIIGYSQLLKQKLEGTVEDKSLQMIEKINVSAAFMLRLINDLLDVSVIESGKVSLHLADVNLPDLIQDNLSFLMSIAEKKQIKLVFNNKHRKVKVLCDPNKIAQVINNLVTNAVKFSKNASVVEVDLETTPTEVIVAVKDHGMGMSPETQAQLFQPFSKGSIGTAGEKSTGLGLAIVQKIVKEHKGKIWIESKLGEGSSVYFSLPYVAKMP